jgi:hypothetical protein
MNRLSHFIDRIANWKSFLVFLALYALFSGYILKNAEDKINALAGKSVGVIDLTFGYNPTGTLTMVADYGGPARAFYAWTEMTTDLLYPIVYAFMLGIALALLYRSTPYGWFCLIPFICLLFDYLENIAIVILLKTFPQQSTSVAILCEIFKLTKWIIFGAIILLVMIGVVVRLTKRTRLTS